MAIFLMTQKSVARPVSKFPNEFFSFFVANADILHVFSFPLGSIMWHRRKHDKFLVLPCLWR